VVVGLVGATAVQDNLVVAITVLGWFTTGTGQG
jgi:hypothetical protein